MTNPTVLVTGATGTVGSALSPALKARGATVRAMIRSPFKAVPGVENVVTDLTGAPARDIADFAHDHAGAFTRG
ncbi:NAD-dependent epimerase/dehydratase family protein [Nocardiopsis sp. CT-R113]|uniref:NAD-dependent epimerase/dehydratase family protein n=1 Tax=Nocardiopsis codii TaxID=3065942 RepID=A0ABU7K229_9ACTN|nr:NAD-dependent epimerase/dehydratase family protein [Nocardiopsis sp. CT-R113]MEE2036293.1 NAD-dependent epimerase/dehydratase family protein [Nocardiopsis sp. CT-R113]